MQYSQEEINEKEKNIQKELNDLIANGKANLNECSVDDNIAMVKHNILVKMINQFALNIGVDESQYKPANHNQHLRKIPRLVTQEINNHPSPLFTVGVKTRCYLDIMKDFREETLYKGDSLSMANVLNYIIKNC